MEYEDCKLLIRMGVPRDRIHKAAIVSENLYHFYIFTKVGKKYCEYREFLCYKIAEVEVDGEMILLVYHGVSGNAASPIMKELLEMGVKIVIRCGKCGTYKPSTVKSGDLSITYASVRDDTSSMAEIDVKYPAVADFDVIDCLVDTAEELGIDASLGINYSSDLFYRRTCKDDHRDIYPTYNIGDTEESETATIFVLCSLYGAKAGAVMTIDGTPLYWSSGGYIVGEKIVDVGIEKMTLLASKAASKLSNKYRNNQM
ncbi:Uridine phosphorylase [Theileria parva strain Muguga]|uniref:Purine nucleoside phosphorylase, putative n=1 Tax=Theileria parva TaxID=5875 RepID=Q4N553_THEPA|nr:Uridine phosphorylase [Theileria parva strain Muguga]EAN32720.1 Uridine phosphorylase [Theileria parva strain Muguga]|eukprot:XP_765003.1 purine nucleoside phosphorylase [Theileria parva strain Muguga]